MTMNEIYTTVQGRVVAPPESRTTRGGVPFTAFRLASTVRRPNPQTRTYEDGPTNFFNVTAFRTLGANVGNSLKKGDPVVVYGRLRVNQWMRSDNIPATSVEIDAYSVGHDLTWGTTELVRVSRAQVDQSDRLADEAVQQVHAAAGGPARPRGRRLGRLRHASGPPGPGDRGAASRPRSTPMPAPRTPTDGAVPPHLATV